MSVQQKVNWTDLPDDIKRMIFDFNRNPARSHWMKNWMNSNSPQR